MSIFEVKFWVKIYKGTMLFLYYNIWPCIIISTLKIIDFSLLLINWLIVCWLDNQLIKVSSDEPVANRSSVLQIILTDFDQMNNP